MNRPIGIFDSGLGGLTVARRIIERLPQESISYVGDEAHIPYGEKSPEEIQNFALGITN
ncbi:MAG TPA: glutamate racemase, partial [Armatimonadetes bacterium]|nr:glutamate racemase [Armatimonadota bacterium]